MDHHYDFTCVHLIKYQTRDKSVEAKEALKAYDESHGVNIRNYHSEDGIFRSARWMNHFKDTQQGLTFAGVNYHHQNGRAERRIRSLQDLARCQMIHSQHRWPITITSNLWTYTTCHASANINGTLYCNINYKSKPTHMFSRPKVD